MRDHFVKTDTILDKILAHKAEEIAQAEREISLNQIRAIAEATTPSAAKFKEALHKDTVALIAEIKHASPSKGILIEDFHPVALAKTYVDNGASALSILTDDHFFMGSLSYISDVGQTLGTPRQIPILRKDFIIAPYQIYQSRAHQADAILLIAAALDDAQLGDLRALALDLGMDALLEVHNEEEMARALKIGAELIGINNRDLRTFHVDLNITARLSRLAPDHITLVAESGIMNADDVYQMGRWGAHAVLVGESLVKAKDIGQAVRHYATQRREPQKRA